MNARLKILAEAVAGAAGGLVAWVIVEPIPFLTTDPRPGEPPPVAGPAFWWSLAIFGAVMGCFIGGLIGAVEGLATGSLRKLNRAIVIGAAVGLGGGLVGLFFGQIVYQSIAPGDEASAFGPDLVAFFTRIVARGIGWALVGLAIGAAQGVPTASLRKMWHGLIGGLIGGALGGILFQLTAYIVQTPELSRMVGMTVTGGFIGFFVGLVQDLLKHAWVVVLRGRNEGRQYVLDKPESVLGRDELADVGVFGDVSVALRHALIRAVGGRYVIEDLGASPAGTLVNGQRVASQGLADGDEIQLGSSRLVFHEKAGAAPMRQTGDVVAPRPQRPVLPDNMCPFCGQQKDPATGACACTPVAAPSPAFAPLPHPEGTAAPGPGLAASFSPAAGPRLAWVSGPLAGQVTPLVAAEVTLGREAGRDVVLQGDPTASRRHATLRREADTYAITDDGSANGTFVNGARVQFHILKPGDRVRLGQSEFVYES